jgi:hypothetical protein
VTPGNAEELWDLLRSHVDPGSLQWLDDALDRVRQDRAALAASFPAVGRHLGRQPLRSGPVGDQAGEHDWTVDDAGRALLLLAVGDAVWDELDDLYRFGDAAERRAVLRSLHLLPPRDAGPGPDVGLRLVDDAVRSNDPRLLAAALGPYARERMSDEAFHQAVLKCVFVGVRLDGLEGLAERVTPGLSRRLAAYARERVAAGRDVPADVWPLVDAHPPLDELAAIEAELQHPVPSRREAAAAALSQRAAHRRRANGSRAS